MFRVGLIPVLALASTASPALAGDRELIEALDRGLGATVVASQAAAGGTPSLVQIHYDLARDLQEGVRSAAPLSTGCHALGGWAARYAAAEAASAEGLDRLDPARARRFRRVAEAARARVVTARRACRPATARRRPWVPALNEPRPWAASFGEIAARTPPGADAAALFVNGASAGPLVMGDGYARARLSGQPGRYDLEVRFTRRGTIVGYARSARVWLLPTASTSEVREASTDASWQAQVRSAAAGFAGICGVWVHDLATGRSASWNAGAAFPAASTVKLGVLVEAIRRMGPQPEQSAMFHDVRAIASWSSNLASNRLLRRIGGSGAAQSALARMGATSSTFTGPYIVATERPAVDAPSPPPRVSRRVTTAYDLAMALTTLHEAALGQSSALARTRMTRSQARLALGLLLASEASGDNIGLFREALGPSVPAAQKHGWISSARHSAAVIYTTRGPVVVAALTYRPGLALGEAARLGQELVMIATSAP